MNKSGPGLFEAVIESWRLVIANAGELARIALVPFLLFIALNRLEATFEPEGMGILARDLLFTVLAAPPAAMLLMPWYRRLLSTADPAMAARPAMWWSVALMVRWVGLDIMVFAALAPVLAMAIQADAAGGEAAPPPEILFIYLTTIIIGFYLFYGRMGLSVPAAAAESDHRYRRSWVATRENGWRIGLAFLLCWVPIQFLIEILGEPLDVENPTMAMQYFNAALGAAVRVLSELVGAAVFAQFYLAQTAPPLEGEW
ncbi:MAG: hypothetical protein IMF08_17225 [Proteobacteria bacterium]|nr:hypothetical protein [Pseudomonadota bacterium]